MRTVFCREVSPRTTVTLRSGTPNARRGSAPVPHSPCRRPAARRGGASAARRVTVAVNTRHLGALRSRLHVQRQHERSPPILAPPVRDRPSCRRSANDLQHRELQPAHREHQQQLQRRRSGSAARGRACRRSAGSTRRIGARKRNVIALSTPASGPSGATHDRIACAITTTISSHSDRLQRARRRRSSSEHRQRRRPPQPPPPSTSRSASSHRNWASQASSSVDPVDARTPRQHPAQRLHHPVGQRDHRLAERIAERRAQPLHREAQQERVGEEAEHDVEQESQGLVEHGSPVGGRSVVAAEGVAELAGARGRRSTAATMAALTPAASSTASAALGGAALRRHLRAQHRGLVLARAARA